MKKKVKFQLLSAFAIFCLFLIFTIPIQAAERKVPVGKEITLSFKSNADYSVTWKVESPALLQQTGTGRSSVIIGSYVNITNSATFKGLQPGSTLVSAYNANTGALVYSDTVTIVPSVDFKLDYNILFLDANKSFQLKALNIPEGVSLIWQSDNPYASVDDTGKVFVQIPYKKTTITCTTSDGMYDATCIVYGETPTYNSSQQFTVGQRSKLTYSLVQPGPFNFDIKWKTSNSSLVSIDSDGNIITHKKGFVMITGEIGNYVLRYTLRVSNPVVAPEPDIFIGNVSISAIKTQIYNKKALTPSIKITYSGQVLQESVDYTVSYSNNTKPGKAVCTVTGIGKYSGSVKVYFYIAPQKQTIKYLKSSKSKTATVKFQKVYGQSGVQICYSTNSKFKNAKFSTSTSTSKTISKLTGKKTYYFKIRSYKTINGKKVYGPYSSVKKLKIKA